MRGAIKRLGENYRVLVSNFISLSSLEGANYILSLVTLPYLVRVLGPGKYGLIAFAQVFIQGFIILTDYGFCFSATRSISIHRNDNKKISQIFISVLLIKIALLLVSFLILTGVVFFVPKFRTDWVVYFFTFGMVIGYALFPIWFFLGMERMKFITFINLFSKLVIVIATFIFIKSQADYIYVPLVNAIGLILAGVIGLWVAAKKFKLKFSKPGLPDIMRELEEGWHVFISTVAISLYGLSNTFILGLFASNVVVGYYSAVEKLIKSGQKILVSLTQAVYPYITKLASESRPKAIVFIRKILKIIGIFSSSISAAIFIFARPIVDLLLGPQYKESIIVLKILAFVPFMLWTGTGLTVFFLLGLGYIKVWTRIALTCTVISIIGSFLLIYVFSWAHIGAAISCLVTELCVLIFNFTFYRKITSK